MLPQVVIAADGHRMKEPEAPQGWGLANQGVKNYLETLHDNDRAKVGGGHLAYGLHERVSYDCQYMTVIRDPIERVISLYSTFKSRPASWHQDRPIGDPMTHFWKYAYNMDLASLLATDGHFVLQNDQTRMITGGSEDAAEAIALLQERYIWTTTGRLRDICTPICDYLGIEHSSDIGYDNRLERVTGYKKDPVERYKPTEEEMAAIIKANQADIRLYEWASGQIPAIALAI
jgi:hypothetical protein